MSLPIVELFPALQGEGFRMGVPSIFVRTGGCTLTCKGFGCTMRSPIDQSEIVGCDSIMAVATKHFKHEWMFYETSKELIIAIENAFLTRDAYGAKPEIIFTGGEPLLHHKNEVMIETVEYFISRGYNVWFETNGTVDVDFNQFSVYKKVNFSISVKMKNSGEKIENRWKPEIVNAYLANTSESYFKFVYSGIDEGVEIKQFLEMVPTYAPVYIMPLGATKPELEKNAILAYEFAFNNSFRYSDRLHIRIYNDLRSV